MSEAPKLATRRERNQQTAADFDEFIAPLSGDMFLTAKNIFPGFRVLEELEVYFDEELDGVRGGVNEDGEAGIWIGSETSIVTPRLKSRLIERFRLPEDFVYLPNQEFMPIVIAHELGHVIQDDSKFTGFFGPISDEVVDETVSYEGYVNSDVELSADYIAATIIANSEFGQILDIMPPAEAPLEWRAWGATHGVPNTISRYS